MKLSNVVVAEILVALGFFACVSIPSRAVKIALIILLLPAIFRELKKVAHEEQLKEDIRQ